MSAREESHELGRSYVFGVIDYFKSMHYPSGASQFNDVSNAYDSPHFCEIPLDNGKKIAFDILMKRVLSNHNHRFWYIECKFIGSTKTASRVENHHQEFLEKVYKCIEPATKCHRGNVDFIFISNALIHTYSRIDPNIEDLLKLLKKTEENDVNTNRIHMMCGHVKYMHIPVWLIEQYREEVVG